ncbi:MAG TPA: methyltransferase domain-containing protein [Acidimicrobiales bacterium]
MSDLGFGQKVLDLGGVWCIDTAIEDYLHGPSVVNLRGWIAIRDRSVEVGGVFLGGRDGLALNLVRRPDVEAAFSSGSVIAFDDVVPVRALVDASYALTLEADGQIELLELPEIADGPEKAAVFAKLKQDKLRRLRPFLACPRCGAAILDQEDRALFCENCHLLGAVTESGFSLLGPGDVTFPLEPPFSSLPYDPDERALIAGSAGGLVLDDGSGLRYEYFDDVVNLDLSEFPTTDVLGSAAALPFAEATFDGVLSVAVLEHVPDPSRCVREIAKVLKPGGWVFAAVPGLQPYHGYPKHYFNTTRDGLAELFSEQFAIDDITTSPFGLPIHALSWFLDRYLGGLPASAREVFASMTVSELAVDPTLLVGQEFVTTLDAVAVSDLACVNVLRAKRR